MQLQPLRPGRVDKGFGDDAFRNLRHKLTMYDEGHSSQAEDTDKRQQQPMTARLILPMATLRHHLKSFEINCCMDPISATLKTG